MPRQNRVTPFGEIIATPARGTFMGNRGCLHNDRQQLVRPYQVKRWIICQLAFKNRHRRLMAPGRYTELFFLDEATALAAGHRPCSECRRQSYLAFRAAWAETQPGYGSKQLPRAKEMDALLHRERLNQQGEKILYEAAIGELPDGVFIALASRPCLLWQKALFPWSPAGYGPPVDGEPHPRVKVLTPRSTVAAIRHGYVPQVHHSAGS